MFLQCSCPLSRLKHNNNDFLPLGEREQFYFVCDGNVGTVSFFFSFWIFVRMIIFLR